MAPLPAPVSAHPSWLNKAFFTNIVRQDYTTCKIVGFSVNPANPKGENYASVLYRVKARVENDKNGLAQRSFIVKVNHDAGQATQLASDLSVFPKEIEMYTEILPQFEKYFAAIGEPTKVGPRCYFAHTEPFEVIVMDDIGSDGYKTADRLQGLDMEHCKLAIAKIAKFHAASAKYTEEIGNFSDKFKEGIFAKSNMSEAREKMRGQFMGLLKMFMQGLKCTPTLNKVFDNSKVLLGERVYDCVELKKDRFNVLCHGDLWSNNIMFKYSDEGKLEDCLLVDYQMCFYGSPMLDLQYFIISSVRKEFKLAKTDHLLQFYHNQLAANLKKLNYQRRIPTLLELQMDFLDCGAYGAVTSLTVFPITTAPGAEDSDVDSLLDEGAKGLAIKKRIYTNPKFTEAIEELIPYFERKGYFDL